MASLNTQELEDAPTTVPLHDPNYDYYSIDNILEEDALLKIRTFSSIPHAQCLRGSDDNGIIPENTELELPAWIVFPLLRDQCVELIDPSQFEQQFLSQLWAEPTVINLRYRCPSFYELGSRYSQISNRPSLLILLLRTFLDRSQLISKTAQSRYDQDNSNLLKLLTNSEQRLFYNMISDVAAEKGWWQRNCLETRYTDADHASKRIRLSTN